MRGPPPSSCSGKRVANALIIEPYGFSIARADQLQGCPASNLANDYRGVIWRAPPGNTASLVVDLGDDRPVDVVMLFGLAGNVPATASVIMAGATSVQGPGFDGQSVRDGGSGPGSFSVETGVAPFAGSDPTSPGNGVLFWRKPSDWPANIRYLSLYATGLTATGYLIASRLVIGQAIVLERNFSFGAEFGVKDLGAVEFSRRGVLLRNRGAKLRTMSLTFSSLRRDEVEQLTAPLLQRIGNTDCVALVTDPAPHAQRQSRCYFGPLVGDLGQTWRRANAWEAKINMVSLF